MNKIKVKDFITVPAWNTCGLVVGVLLPNYGSEDVQHVLLQEGSEPKSTKHYHLEPGQYTIKSKRIKTFVHFDRNGNPIRVTIPKDE